MSEKQATIWYPVPWGVSAKWKLSRLSLSINDMPLHVPKTNTYARISLEWLTALTRLVRPHGHKRRHANQSSPPFPHDVSLFIGEDKHGLQPCWFTLCDRGLLGPQAQHPGRPVPPPSPGAGAGGRGEGRRFGDRGDGRYRVPIAAGIAVTANRTGSGRSST